MSTLTKGMDISCMRWPQAEANSFHVSIQAMAGILGGVFGLEPERTGCDDWPVEYRARLDFVNGRSCINFLLNVLTPSTIWLPSYLCGAVFDAVKQTGAAVRFFGINAALEVESWDWLGSVKSGDFILLIDYFGFPIPSAYTERIRDTGAFCLEDACQALFAVNRSEADFVVYSPRKFVGVPDGGILLISDPSRLPCTICLDTPPPSWWLDALHVSLARREFDRCGSPSGWFERFQRVEACAPTGNFRMSDLSRAVLSRGINYVEVAERRIANYRLLADRLFEIALLPTLGPDVVPLGFPIRTASRDRILQVLFRHQIYPPVHWPLAGIVPPEYKESHALSSEIMTLPCDQRYIPAQMEVMADLVRQALRS